MELYDHQLNALDRMRNGCILNGGVGTGKSRTSLAYYFLKVADGSLQINGKGKYRAPKNKIPLYIITTARKRDTNEWESEMVPFLLSTDYPNNLDIQVKIDSWNNISKYINIQNAFFIFDEQRVVGNGTWVKSFLKITRLNQWILLSATPGDTWTDYIPVFLANGFYNNRTQFYKVHCIFDRFAKYPKIKQYVNTRRLENLRNMVLVDMDVERKTIQHHIPVICDYSKDLYRTMMITRTSIFELDEDGNPKPFKQASELCYGLRRLVNSDSDRIVACKKIIGDYPRVIIFYNFDYELEMLRQMCIDNEVVYGEWNGHKHEPIPKTDQWIYLVQYTAGCEGWNCIDTNAMIFFSQSYSYKTMVQAAGRIDRINTPYIDLYYFELRSTSPIDRAIYSALKNKKNFNEKKFVEK